MTILKKTAALLLFVFSLTAAGCYVYHDHPDHYGGRGYYKHDYKHDRYDKHDWGRHDRRR